MLNIFKNNKLDGHFISDVLIEMTLNIMGENKVNVEAHFEGTARFHEQSHSEDIVMLFTKLKNGCMLGITLEKDKVYKINIYLNKKPGKKDIDNLKAFEAVHSDEYYFVSLFKENIKKYYIGFESKIY